MKGIIIAAGYGARCLPVTKTIPKEMLPLGCVPAIQFIVDEFIKSGISEIIIVSSRRKKALEDYFDYVFVPSRQNIRVDDIQFITPSRVYVIMEMAQAQRAAVHILEKNGNGSWKLVGKD